MGIGYLKSYYTIIVFIEDCTYLKWYGEECDEYVSERQVCQVVIGDRPHPLAGDDGPYDQPVSGHSYH